MRLRQTLEQSSAPRSTARRRAAHLHVDILPDRLQIEHRVEGRDLEHADVRHAEHFGDVLDRGFRQPAAVPAPARATAAESPPIAGGPPDISRSACFAHARFSAVKENSFG